MKIPFVKFGGLRAWVAGYVHQYYNVYCLSTFGAVGAVRGVSAAFVSGRTVELHETGEQLYRTYLYRGWGKENKFRLISKRLPTSRMLSMVVLSEQAILSNDQDFLIISRQADPVDLLFRNLVKRSELPLHESWKKWLWQTFQENEWLTELEGYRMRGYRISFTDEELAEKLAEGVRSERITRIG